MMKKTIRRILIWVPPVCAFLFFLHAGVCFSAKERSGKTALRVAVYPPALSASVAFEEPCIENGPEKETPLML